MEKLVKELKKQFILERQKSEDLSKQLILTHQKFQEILLELNNLKSSKFSEHELNPKTLSCLQELKQQLILEKQGTIDLPKQLKLKEQELQEILLDLNNLNSSKSSELEQKPKTSSSLQETSIYESHGHGDTPNEEYQENTTDSAKTISLSKESTITGKCGPDETDKDVTDSQSQHQLQCTNHVNQTPSMKTNSGSEDADVSQDTSIKKEGTTKRDLSGIKQSKTTKTTTKVPKDSKSTEQVTAGTYSLPTYKKRQGTQNLGLDFEKIMCACYALKLAINTKVADFKMCSNNEGYEKFDDVSFTVSFSDGGLRIYMIQLKHKENKKIFLTDLKKNDPKSDFGVRKYIESISRMDPGKEPVYILYTNCPTKINVTTSKKLWNSFVLEQCTEIEFEDVLVNSTEKSKNEIFEIKADNLKPKFYFFTSQMNVQQTEEKIKALLKRLLQTDIYGAFISYMRYWWSSRFFLTKRDVFAKISELAFSPYLASLSAKKSNTKTESLTEAIMGFPLTIVKSHKKNIVEDMWKIEQSWINKEFNMTEQKYGPTDDQQNRTLWYLGKLPLIVKVDEGNKHIIKCIMNFLLKTLEDKKIVLIGKATREDFPEWNIFENLSDVIGRSGEKEFCSNLLKEFKVSFQGKENYTMEDLVAIDTNVAKTIEIKELLQMSQQDCLHIGFHKKEELPKSHIPRRVSPLFVKTEEIFNCCKSSRNTILVVNCDQSFADTLSKNRDVKLMELSEYLERTPDKDRKNLILLSTKDKCTIPQFETICNKSPKANVYLIQHIQDDYCILILRKGRKLGSEDTTREEAVRENEIFKYYSDSLHVFCAPPGMGKSTLMKVLYNDCPHLSVYVRLIDYNPFLNELPDFEKILDRFLHFDETKIDLKLDRYQHVDETKIDVYKMRKYCFQNRKLYMFLDGLDEVNSQHVGRILDFVKKACSQGGIIWLSSRENLREKMCQTLNVVPIDIKDLEKDEQKTYINYKLTEKYNEKEIEKITEAISRSADLTNSQKLLGIPLLLHIVTEIFLQDKQVYPELEQKNHFVLTQMYKIFFKGKINFAYSKLVDEGLVQQLPNPDYILPSYELPALRTCLHKDDYELLRIDPKEAEGSLEQVKKEGDKNGIIRDVNENGQVVFEHQTYAEYFTCIWFKKNPEKFKKLREKIFTKDYENLRLIFDVILAENNPLHLSVLYKDSESFKNCLEDPECKHYDDGGRTAFHLAFSYGRRYPRQAAKKRKFLLELRTLKREESSYVDIIKVLLKDGKIPDTEDELLTLDCVSYAVQSGCLYPIEEILRTKSLAFSKLEEPLKKCFDEMALAYCSAQLGYPYLLSEFLKSDKISGIKEELLEMAMKGCEADVCTLPRDGNIDAVKILIKNDATLTSKMDQVLQEACQKHLFDMIGILMENEAKCSNGNTILHYVVESCPETYRPEIVHAIEKFEVDVNAPNNKGVTALHKAAESADLKIVEALMDKGADLSVVDHDGRNVLHHASYNSRQEVLEFFLKKGLPVDRPDKKGATALHLASEKGKVENVRLLLAKYVNFHLVDNDKNNALHYASRSSTPNQPVIKLLVDKCLAVNQQNQLGHTPLHLAWESKNFGNLEILLEQNPDLNIEDKKGNSLFNYVVKSSFTHCKDFIKLLKSKDFDINRENQNGLALIHFAYRRGNFEIVDFLLGIGAKDNLNARFENGETLLHWVCKREKYEIAMELLRRGIDANIVDDQNRNALYYSLNQEYRPALVHRMIKYGLNLNTRYQNGQTLLHLACFNCDTQTVRELSENGVEVNTLDDDYHGPLDTVLKALPDIETSVKDRLHNRNNSDTDTQHEHESDTVQFGCVNCYRELVRSLEKVAEGKRFEDSLRQTLSMFIDDGKIVDAFITDVVATNSVNDNLHIVARFMIFEMVNYLIRNELKISNIAASNRRELDYSFELEQDYPEINHLLK